MKQVLTIAGHDLSGGAGITKDLEIFLSLGLAGFSVPTSLVIQGPAGVRSLEPVSLSAFTEMLETVSAECRVEGVKIGVVGDEHHALRIARFLGNCPSVPVVLDPVLKAKNGYPLLNPDGLTALIRSVFPLTTVVTPNIQEAGQITGMMPDDLEAMKRAAEQIASLGPKNVVIKGGHLSGQPVDLLFDGKEFRTRERKRMEKVIHGTGCAFSSLMLSFLVLGLPVQEAFYETENLLDLMLKESSPMGTGDYCYTSLSSYTARNADRWQVLSKMAEAADRLEQLNPVELIPQVQMNVGYALRDAKGIEDVAAFPGRIGTKKGRIFIKGPAEFGVSSYVARLILTYMKYHPFMRSCVNIRYSEATTEAAKGRGLSVFFFDRRRDPGEVKEKEGRSLDFLVDQALKGIDWPPDIIYDHGDVGKEPIIRLFAREPKELMEKMEALLP